jgi:hypothetical protein
VNGSLPKLLYEMRQERYENFPGSKTVKWYIELPRWKCTQRYMNCDSDSSFGWIWNVQASDLVKGNRKIYELDHIDEHRQCIGGAMWPLAR